MSRLRVQISHSLPHPKARRRAAEIMVRANRASQSPAERASPEDCAALLKCGSPGSPSRPRTGLSSCQRGGPDAAQVGKAHKAVKATAVATEVDLDIGNDQEDLPSPESKHWGTL